MLKYQANPSWVVLSLILMTTLLYKALILQGEIWCWSLLVFKGLKNKQYLLYLYVSVRALRREFQVTNRKMKKYEKEYLLMKEQEAQLEDPIERLQVISCSKHYTCFHSCLCAAVHLDSGPWHL